MRKGTSFLWAAMAVFTFAADTQAQQGFPGTDDCGALANLVHGEVVASTLFSGYRLAPEPTRGEPLICNQTASAVASGFSSAMAAINVYVAWSTPADRPGDTCLGHDITLCYPVQSPFVPSGAWDAADVAATWQVVVNVVSRTMPLGTASDQSRFHEYDLRLRLNFALSNRFAVFGNPVHGSPKR